MGFRNLPASSRVAAANSVSFPGIIFPGCLQQGSLRKLGHNRESSLSGNPLGWFGAGRVSKWQSGRAQIEYL